MQYAHYTPFFHCSRQRFMFYVPMFQAQWCGIKSLSMQWVTGFRRRRSMCSVRFCAVQAVSVCSEDLHWWTTMSWSDTPPKPHEPLSMCSMIKVNLPKLRILSCIYSIGYLTCMQTIQSCLHLINNLKLHYLIYMYSFNRCIYPKLLTNDDNRDNKISQQKLNNTQVLWQILVSLMQYT